MALEGSFQVTSTSISWHKTNKCPCRITQACVLEGIQEVASPAGVTIQSSLKRNSSQESYRKDQPKGRPQDGKLQDSSITCFATSTESCV